MCTLKLMYMCTEANVHADKLLIYTGCLYIQVPQIREVAVKRRGVCLQWHQSVEKEEEREKRRGRGRRRGRRRRSGRKGGEEREGKEERERR